MIPVLIIILLHSQAIHQLDKAQPLHFHIISQFLHNLAILQLHTLSLHRPAPHYLDILLVSTRILSLNFLPSIPPILDFINTIEPVPLLIVPLLFILRRTKQSLHLLVSS
jgi:hypothetical protein